MKTYWIFKRLNDNKWTKRVIEWRNREEAKRSRRRSTRCSDDLKRIYTNWMQAFQDESHMSSSGLKEGDDDNDKAFICSRN